MVVGRVECDSRDPTYANSRARRVSICHTENRRSGTPHMEVARHDSLADQLLGAARPRRSTDDRRRRRPAGVRARSEAERGGRGGTKTRSRAEARRQAEEQALAEARAKHEAEERRALQVLEVELRGTLERKAQAHATELQSELERESQAKVETGLREARKRARLAMAGAVIAVLVSAGVPGYCSAPGCSAKRLKSSACVSKRRCFKWRTKPSSGKSKSSSATSRARRSSNRNLRHHVR